MLKSFVEEITKEFKLTLYGMDLLVSENNEDIYLIDINYMSSFQELKNLEVEKEVRKLIHRKLNASKIK